MSKPSVSLDRSRRWLMPALLGAVGMLVVVAAAVWWNQRPEGGASRVADAASGSGPLANPFGSGRAVTGADANGPGHEPLPAWMKAGADGPGAHLPELTKEEAQALQDAVQGQPNAQGELARLIAFARFQKGFERWQSLREQSAPAAERTALARELLQMLGDRLQQHEMMAGEALMVQAALLEDAEPDPTRRQVVLEQLRAQTERLIKQQNEAMAPQERKAAAQQQELERLQSDIVRRCQAEGCDQKSLESQLDAARVKVYGQ